MSSIISETQQWLREGRGKTFQFFATSEEMVEILGTALPVQFAPYSIFGTFLVKEGKFYKHDYLSGPITDFPLFRARGIWQFFIQSQVLSSELLITPGSNIDHLCVANGLINLQQGSLAKSLPNETHIGLVDKVRNTVTGELRQHADYLKIFNAIKQAVQKQPQQNLEPSYTQAVLVVNPSEIHLSRLSPP
ncbi:MAG: hypothetical protein BWK78_02175 [Thiotrichaceae bacterium IS1]|nr:MAG: hypothetical protein BWK78_02175 [Thiotrichaceae bacterium IS1]